MKRCIICGNEKFIYDFYKHPQMKDGYTNKCKECTKKQVSEREIENRKDFDYVLKERKRGREKYKRLGYINNKPSFDSKKSAISTYKSKYPEKYKAKNLSQRIFIEKGFERHYWNYNELFAKDIIPLSKEDHNLIHTAMYYDQSLFMYRKHDGTLLETKESHINLLNQLKCNTINQNTTESSTTFLKP